MTILIGYDGSACADAAIATTAALKANTYVQEPAYTVTCEVDERERSRLRAVSHASADVLRRAGLATTCSVLDGDPRDILLAEADLSNADAIFVGARGIGRMERLLLGSVSSHIVSHARCTVEVLRNYGAFKSAI